MPEITVVMPTYNSEKYIKEAIDSIRAQSFKDWNMLVINEHGSDDNTRSIVEAYEKRDTRIQLVQNETKLGLADSLNRGIRLATGKYIARMDADDLAHPDRFQKQWEYLESHPDVIVLGTAQHHFGPNTDWVHRPATTAEQCKANLLFMCDVCHSTVMLRKQIFIENSLFYDSVYFAEDYELWMRALKYGKITNLSEVLGEYRWGTENITKSKKKQLAKESGEFVAKNLKEHLQIDLTEEETFLMNGWSNPCFDSMHRWSNLKKIKRILQNVYEQNQKKLYVNEKCMLQIIGAKWRWDKYYEPITNGKKEKSIEAIFAYNGCATFVQRFFDYMKKKIKLC